MLRAWLRYGALAVPLIGLAELGAYFWFARRAPTADEWRRLGEVVTEVRKPGDLVAVAPYWAEPNARWALGDEVMPLEDVARADESTYPRVLEVSALGASVPEVEGWRVVEERRAGPILVRVRENPSPARVVRSFTDSLRPPVAAVFERVGADLRACPFSEKSPVTAGGLGGHPTFPEERFSCGSGELFLVGVTVIDDERYRPRRCIWAHPPRGGSLVIRFDDVELGAEIAGHAGLPWLLERQKLGTPVELAVSVAGETIGRIVHEDGEGWKGFRLPTGAAGERADVDFEVSSKDATHRHFCFAADTR